MNKQSQRDGVLFVVSAPSGAGKTSLCRELIDNVQDLSQSISFATREIRAGEQDGVDYHFIDEPAFRDMISDHKLAEWAEVHGNLYGTSITTLKQAALDGVDLLLDIDCQGAAQLRKNYHQGVFIFILPPDMQVLEQRLRDRGTNSAADIQRRLKNAHGEIKQAAWYDYLVVNDTFAAARDKLTAIISAERCKAQRNKFLLNQFHSQEF
ncbi:MAG: guanylate kinase [Desulfuromonadales bacterium]|nr:guanylate kinase [Desulfuromonadales bacterium]